MLPTRAQWLTFTAEHLCVIAVLVLFSVNNTAGEKVAFLNVWDVFFLLRGLFQLVVVQNDKHTPV